MSAISIYGFDKQFVQHLLGFNVPSLTLNTTTLYIPVMIPVGFGPVRVVKVTWVASASLVQASGTSTVQVQVGQAAALRTIVTAQSVLGGVANVPAEFTLAAETSLKEQTVDENGIFLITLAVSNNALGTNGALGVNIFWHSIPRDTVGDDLKHQSNYR